MGTLELIIGPMFSGKTKLLIEKYNNLCTNYPCLAINHSLDKRYGIGKIISHDGLEIDSILAENLDDIYDNHEKQLLFLKAKYIFINEAQFFKNLKDWINIVVNIMKKNVILCGLDMDYKKDNFGEIMDLVPFATKIHKLQGKCQYCDKPSLYSHRKNFNENRILIGGSEEYIPVCEKCYSNLNNLVI